MADATAPDTGTETPTTDAIEETAGTDTEPEVDWKAEAEKHRALARKHEDRAKANATAAKELEALKQQSMSDVEKAIAMAKTEARTEVLREVGGRVVDAEVRAAVAGRNIDADALLDGLDRSRFVTEDGEPDRDAITAWVDRIAPKPAEDDLFRVPDLGQGARGSGGGTSDPLLDMVKKLTGSR